MSSERPSTPAETVRISGGPGVYG